MLTTTALHPFSIEYRRPDSDHASIATFANKSDAFNSAACIANDYDITVLVLKRGMLYGKVEPNGEDTAPAWPRDHNSPNTDARPTKPAKNASGLDRLLQRPTERLLIAAKIAAAPKVNIYRISMAYDSQRWPYTADTAHARQEEVAKTIFASLAAPGAPLDVGISFGYGAGAWGCEPCVHVETATPNDITDWLVGLLDCWTQDCAYVSVNGRTAYEVNHRGKWSPITGIDTDAS